MLYKWKVCVLGDASVGKTSLVRHYCEGMFREDYLSTIGVSFLRKDVKLNINGINSEITLQLWDLGGQTIFSGVRVNYLRGTNGALILFDLTNKLTLSHVNNWYDDVVKTAGKIPVLVIGNKSDLEYSPSNVERAKKLCESLGLELFLTSAKTGSMMNEIFDILSRKMIQPESNGGKQ
jgi:small GTP-binding protein